MYCVHPEHNCKPNVYYLDSFSHVTAHETKVKESLWLIVHFISVLSAGAMASYYESSDGESVYILFTKGYGDNV